MFKRGKRKKRHSEENANSAIAGEEKAKKGNKIHPMLLVGIIPQVKETQLTAIGIVQTGKGGSQKIGAKKNGPIGWRKKRRKKSTQAEKKTSNEWEDDPVSKHTNTFPVHNL